MLGRVAAVGGDAGGVEERVEAVGGVRVGGLLEGGGDAGVDADKEDVHVRDERVGERREMLGCGV